MFIEPAHCKDVHLQVAAELDASLRATQPHAPMS